MARASGPASVANLAAETGAEPVEAAQAADDVDVFVLAVPPDAVPKLPASLFVGRESMIVVDAGNYHPFRDGSIPELEKNDLPDSQWVQQQIGRPVIKALNSINYKSLSAGGRMRGEADRIALPISGDSDAAKAVIANIIDAIGFDPVNVGGIADSWRQQPGSPVYCTNLNRDELTLWINKVDRARMPATRSAGADLHASLPADTKYTIVAARYREAFLREG
ncbi:MAG: NADPH-dependent F420 reductase, partial [Hyphomicrobiaceae bacterium]